MFKSAAIRFWAWGKPQVKIQRPGKTLTDRKCRELGISVG